MTRLVSFYLSCCAAIMALAIVIAPIAQGLDQIVPKSELLLTISGLDSPTNPAGVVGLSVAQFAALPQHQFTTSTTWTEGTPTFQGVLLKDMIASLGAPHGSVHLFALNDYNVTLSTDDAQDDGPLLAYLMNGKRLSLRDKGPVWLVYPYDSSADYRNEKTYAQSIWQVYRIQFEH